MVRFSQLFSCSRHRKTKYTYVRNATRTLFDGIRRRRLKTSPNNYETLGDFRCLPYSVSFRGDEAVRLYVTAEFLRGELYHAGVAGTIRTAYIRSRARVPSGSEPDPKKPILGPVPEGTQKTGTDI